MSDLAAKGKDLLARLKSDVAGKLPDLKKLRKMTDLAKELGMDTSEADKVLDVAEGFADMVEKKLGSK